MNNKYTWHYTDEEYMQLANEQLEVFYYHFNYKDYITPYNESRELIGRIIEEFQYLESCIKHLLEVAVENGIYSGKKYFNFDHFIQATKVIRELTNILIEDNISKELIKLIKFRNYIIHSHYISDNKEDAEKMFPHFLFSVFEAIDYISNVTNRIIGGATHIPNVFELSIKKA